MKLQEYRAMFAVEDGHWWYVGLRHQMLSALDRFAFRRAGASDRQRVLDAGCGTGGFLAHLARADHRWAVGIDLEWEGLRLSRSRGLPHLLQGSVMALPFRADTFDAIVSSDVLYHLGVDDLQTLREFRRVLKPGGVVVLQVPAFEWLRSEHDAAIATRRRYTCAGLERLCEQAGLAVRHSSYRNAFLFPAIAVLRLLKRHRAHAENAQSDVKPTSPFLNAVLTKLLIFESHLVTQVRLPLGVSVFCVAERRVEHHPIE